MFPTLIGPFSDFSVPLVESFCSEDGSGLGGLGGTIGGGLGGTFGGGLGGLRGLMSFGFYDCLLILLCFFGSF